MRDYTLKDLNPNSFDDNTDKESRTWPETDGEREDYQDWQYEVGNGDTVFGYRAWVEYKAEVWNE